jgi:hypothetical protein
MVSQALAVDITGPVQTEDLTPDAAVDELLRRIDHAQPEVAGLVALALDQVVPAAGEDVAIVRLRLRARRRFDGDPLHASELEALGTDPASTRAFGDWLRLQPSGAAVAVVVRQVAASRADLERWARGATLEDRTTAWTAMLEAHDLPARMTAVGGVGVDTRVIQTLRAQVLSAPRQSQRDQAVGLLLTTRIPSQSREASELVLALLATGIVGDALLAIDVARWAGGAHRSMAPRIRQGFATVFGDRGRRLTREQRDTLDGLGLAPRERRNRRS